MSRSIKITIRVTPAQKAELSSRAAAAGVSLSTYIRDLALGVRRRVSVPANGESFRHQIYMSDADWAALQSAALDAGYTASGYVRERCIGEDPRNDGRVPHAYIPDDIETARNILWELKREGNNLNQIARQINSSDDKSSEFLVLKDHLDKVLGRMEELASRIETIFAVPKD